MTRDSDKSARAWSVKAKNEDVDGVLTPGARDYMMSFYDNDNPEEPGVRSKLKRHDTALRAKLETAEDSMRMAFEERDDERERNNKYRDLLAACKEADKYEVYEDGGGRTINAHHWSAIVAALDALDKEQG